MIGFLIRAAFWFTIVLLVLPFTQSGPEPSASPAGSETQTQAIAPARPETEVSSREAVTALQGAVSDVSGFCDRQADACDAGRSVISALGARLRDGAATLAYILDEALDGEDAAPAGAPATPGTLTPEDRSPDWQVGSGQQRPPV
ncbi:DUF5330 domain-containing protein [Amorphus coralli]|uniref:DUF5330 domain-containing protein n=1 Tax=Amorphus coralli TaxID=340680 RepID=UPI00037A6E32|nr:DUF5330 domain-containing protein [Amorphus coralli]